MNTAPEVQPAGVASFRAKLLVAMMLVVVAITVAGLTFARRKVEAETAHDLERDFRSELAALHGRQTVRHAALAERCRALVRRPRIHAALEDNALDLLYPSAKDELRDVMEGGEFTSPEADASVLRARFYRFLDSTGAVIVPPAADEVGALSAEEEAQLSLGRMPEKQQLGYLARPSGPAGESIDEIIAMPIVSTETGEVIAALVLGFKPAELSGGSVAAGIKRGVWVQERLHLPMLAETTRAALAREVAAALAGGHAEGSFGTTIEGLPHRLFFKSLNPESLFPPACEVCLYPLTELLARRRQLLWQAVSAGTLLLAGGLVASHFLAARLSGPVEKLAVDSAEDRAQRERAEAALETTSEELQRSARFSADASHQLKTPVTVLRAGLEEVLAQENLPPEVREEISALIHQTYRLANIIEDLLLLSRMDAGRLQLDFTPVDLTRLIEAQLDDLSAMPDAFDLTVETDFPAALHVAGEPRYTAVILQNLIENARKYNRPGGRIRVTARAVGEWVFLTVANTGHPIPPQAREHIFERFHRGTMGENVPGYGLGLNLARELARVHFGDLRLLRSDQDWTEFEVRLRLAPPAPITAQESA